jgi:hypothetical protein
VAIRTFEHTAVLPAAPDTVVYALSHYEYFLEHQIHLNLARVRFLGERHGADGVTRRVYRNSERVRLGPLRVMVTNTATSYLDTGGVVVGEAFQWPGVHVMTRSKCVSRGDDATLVEEVLTVEAPGLLMATVFAQARRAHEQKFVRLGRVLAGHE